LPGRTQQEAFNSFIEPIERALSCIAHVKLTRSKLNSAFEQNVILQPVPLQFPACPYQLFMNHSFRSIQNSEEWRVTSLKYDYAIELVKTKQEVVAFHWEGHGNGSAPFAHLHLGHANVENAPLLGPKAHIPTDRVAIEDVVYFLIEELKVTPLRDDWQKI
jgi:hypothetical protein